MISIEPPKFLKTLKYLSKAQQLDPKDILERHGKMGVVALASATPTDTGEASRGWSYKVEGNKERYTLTWTNNVLAGRVPLVIILQYGHMTKSGYYLSGIDFINPALDPVLASLLQSIRQEAIL